MHYDRLVGCGLPTYSTCKHALAGGGQQVTCSFATVDILDEFHVSGKWSRKQIYGKQHLSLELTSSRPGYVELFFADLRADVVGRVDREHSVGRVEGVKDLLLPRTPGVQALAVEEQSQGRRCPLELLCDESGVLAVRVGVTEEYVVVPRLGLGGGRWRV